MIAWKYKPKNIKYTNTYERLIQLAKNREVPNTYVEKHHIIPRSFGGSDEKENLVALTAREHYIAHLLLWRMQFPKNYHNKMAMAMAAMMWKLDSAGQRDYKVNSRLYATFKQEYSILMSIQNTGEGNPFYGKIHTEETRKKFAVYHNKPEVKKAKSERVIGDKNPAKDPETRKKISRVQKERLARDKLNSTGSYSPEAKINMSKAQSGANNGRSLTYEFIDKEGKSYTVIGNLSKFCRENVIRTNWVWETVANKTTDKFNGWTVKLLNDQGTRTAIHKDNQQKYVFNLELQQYLDDGWSLGAKPRKKRKEMSEEEKNISFAKRKETLARQRDEGIFIALKGRKRDPEAVKKGADKRRGKSNPLKGSIKLNLSDDERKRRSDHAKSLPKRFGSDNPTFGNPRSDETKRKIAETKLRRKLEKLAQKDNPLFVFH
jgi:hypothetical protein